MSFFEILLIENKYAPVVELARHVEFKPPYPLRCASSSLVRGTWEKLNKIYIIEVKLKWSESLKHTYNKMIPFKKEALDKFCESKSYEMIWLDFNYDKELKIIYNQIRKMEVPN